MFSIPSFPHYDNVIDGCCILGHRFIGLGIRHHGRECKAAGIARSEWCRPAGAASLAWLVEAELSLEPEVAIAF